MLQPAYCVTALCISQPGLVSWGSVTVHTLFLLFGKAYAKRCWTGAHNRLSKEALGSWFCRLPSPVLLRSKAEGHGTAGFSSAVGFGSPRGLNDMQINYCNYFDRYCNCDMSQDLVRMVTFAFHVHRKNIQMMRFLLRSVLCQTSVVPYVWGIWFVGQGISVAPQCFTYDGMLWHLTFIKKVQLLQFGYCTRPYCDFDNI